jgi:hypothetical protein
MIQKWQKKPIPAFEAIQLTKDNQEEVNLFVNENYFPTEDKYVLITTQNGVIAMFEGEWIVKTENGNLFWFSDDEFRKLHKPADN